VVRLTRSGPTDALSAEDLDRLRARFARQSCIQLPGLLDNWVFEFIQDQIARATFIDRVHKDIGVELSVADNPALNLLYFLANDRKVFQLVQRLTGCDRIGAFIGRIYRMVPGSGHYDSWHGDCVAHRMVGMSVNLSPQIYTGGLFQLRERESKTIVTEAPNTGPGDAILFRIATDIEHRVTSVAGTAAKTAFAGWFVSEPDFMSLLTPVGLDSAERTAGV
jgi:hypothetical protein